MYSCSCDPWDTPSDPSIHKFSNKEDLVRVLLVNSQSYKSNGVNCSIPFLSVSYLLIYSIDTKYKKKIEKYNTPISYLFNVPVSIHCDFHSTACDTFVAMVSYISAYILTTIHHQPYTLVCPNRKRAWWLISRCPFWVNPSLVIILPFMLYHSPCIRYVKPITKQLHIGTPIPSCHGNLFC